MVRNPASILPYRSDWQKRAFRLTALVCLHLNFFSRLSVFHFKHRTCQFFLWLSLIHLFNPNPSLFQRINRFDCLPRSSRHRKFLRFHEAITCRCRKFHQIIHSIGNRRNPMRLPVPCLPSCRNLLFFCFFLCKFSIRSRNPAFH